MIKNVWQKASHFAHTQKHWAQLTNDEPWEAKKRADIGISRYPCTKQLFTTPFYFVLACMIACLLCTLSVGKDNLQTIHMKYTIVRCLQKSTRNRPKSKENNIFVLFVCAIANKSKDECMQTNK